MHVFAGRMRVVSNSSCRTRAILNYFCPLARIVHIFNLFVCKNQNKFVLAFIMDPKKVEPLNLTKFGNLLKKISQV